MEESELQKILRCPECTKTCGTRVESSLVLSSGCDYVGNDNGELVCENRGHGSNLPKGGFVHSCIDCQVVEGKLSCRCKASDGNEKETSLALVTGCDSVTNNNGELECESHDIHEEL